MLEPISAVTELDALEQSCVCDLKRVSKIVRLRPLLVGMSNNYGIHRRRQSDHNKTCNLTLLLDICYLFIKKMYLECDLVCFNTLQQETYQYNRVVCFIQINN